MNAFLQTHVPANQISSHK